MKLAPGPESFFEKPSSWGLIIIRATRFNEHEMNIKGNGSTKFEEHARLNAANLPIPVVEEKRIDRALINTARFDRTFDSVSSFIYSSCWPENWLCHDNWERFWFRILFLYVNVYLVPLKLVFFFVFNVIKRCKKSRSKQFSNLVRDQIRCNDRTCDAAKCGENKNRNENDEQDEEEEDDEGEDGDDGDFFSAFFSAFRAVQSWRTASRAPPRSGPAGRRPRRAGTARRNLRPVASVCCRTPSRRVYGGGARPQQRPAPPRADWPRLRWRCRRCLGCCRRPTGSKRRLRVWFAMNRTADH